jgi:hypothetical protein
VTGGDWWCATLFLAQSPYRIELKLRENKSNLVAVHEEPSNTRTPLCVLPITLLVVLASSSSGDQRFYKIVTL